MSYAEDVVKELTDFHGTVTHILLGPVLVNTNDGTLGMLVAAGDKGEDVKIVHEYTFGKFGLDYTSEECTEAYRDLIYLLAGMLTEDTADELRESIADELTLQNYSVRLFVSSSSMGLYMKELFPGEVTTYYADELIAIDALSVVDKLIRNLSGLFVG